MDPQRMMRYLLVLPLLALLTGCGCDADVRASWSPHSKELRVGESFTPSVEFLGCGGTEPLSEVVTWTSDDSTVAAIDSGGDYNWAISRKHVDSWSFGE